jgi:hypothetical protein
VPDFFSILLYDSQWNEKATAKGVFPILGRKTQNPDCTMQSPASVVQYINQLRKRFSPL